MRLRTKLVVLTNKASWVSETTLAIPPFPGLGIRLDVYDILNVVSVVVGDAGFDVTCIGQLEGQTGEAPEEKLTSLGFEIGPYP